MTSEPRREVSIELVSVEASVRQSTVRAAYVVNLTTDSFEGAIGAGETTLDENQAELVRKLFDVVKEIEDSIHHELGLQEKLPDTTQEYEDDL